MRVLIDTNVFISYLLSPNSPGVIRDIVEGLAQGKFLAILPEILLEEITITVSGKPRLAKLVSPEELQQFALLLQKSGEIIPRIQEPIPAVTRDPKDDYLLAYALVGEADYLVTGDKDLLVLQEEIPDLEIVSPRQFTEILSS